MVAVVGSLAVTLQADAGEFSRALGVIGRDVTTMENRVNTGMARMDANFTARLGSMSNAVVGLGRAFAGGLLAGGAVATIERIGSAARRSVEHVARLGDQAKIAGVNLQALQELRFVGAQARIDVDTIVDGLRDMSIEVAEFVNSAGKSGRAVETFKALGYSADDLAEKIKNPSDLFAELIGRLGKFQKASQIKFAEDIFGGEAGAKFVTLIGQGEDGIRRMTAEAHRLHLVMDDGLVEKARELDEIFRGVSDVISTNLTAALVQAADDVWRIVEAFRELDGWRTTSLDERLAEIGKERLETENEILRIRREAEEINPVAKSLGFGPDAATTQKEIDDLQKKQADLAAEEERILGILEKRKAETIELEEVTVNAAQVASDWEAKYREELQKTQAERRLAAETEKILTQARSDGAAITREQAEELARLTIARDADEKSAEKRIATLEREAEKEKEVAERQRERVREFASNVDFEISVSALSDEEVAIARQLRDLNVDINSTEGQRLADNLRLLNLLDDQREKLEQQRDVLKDGISGLLQDVFRGGDLIESFVNFGSRFASMNFDALVDSIFDKPKMQAAGKAMGAEIVKTVANNDNWAGLREVTSGANLAGSVGAYTNATVLGKSAGAAITPAIEGPLNRQVEVIAGAIKKIESGGNYQAIGMQTKYGRPLGAYQILESNLPSWSQQALGRVVSASEFLGNRLTQDQIAYHQFTKLLQKYNGRFEDVAAVWNSGRPLSQSANIVDPYNGQSVGKYVQKVMAQVPAQVGAAAEKGTKAGAIQGIPAGFETAQSNVAGSGGGGGTQLLGGMAGAAFGGFSTGYQSANPGMGLIGGGLQGWGAGSSMMAAFPALGMTLPVIGPVVGAPKGFSPPKRVVQTPRPPKPEQRIAA